MSPNTNDTLHLSYPVKDFLTPWSCEKICGEY